MESLLNKLPVFQFIFRLSTKIKITVIFVILLVLILYFSQVNSHNKIKSGWETAKNISPELLKKVLQIDTNGQITPDSIKVMKISSGEENLYLFDLNSSKFCGITGCIYSLYNSTGKLLLRIILNLHLPPSSKLKFINIIPNINSNKFPCLIFAQADLSKPKVYHTKYCYFQDRFARVNQTYSSISNE